MAAIGSLDAFVDEFYAGPLLLTVRAMSTDRSSGQTKFSRDILNACGATEPSRPLDWKGSAYPPLLSHDPSRWGHSTARKSRTLTVYLEGRKSLSTLASG